MKQHLIMVVKRKLMKSKFYHIFRLLFTYILGECSSVHFSNCNILMLVVGILEWDIVCYIVNYTDRPITTVILVCRIWPTYHGGSFTPTQFLFVL
jgi:hypothetical protein